MMAKKRKKPEPDPASVQPVEENVQATGHIQKNFLIDSSLVADASVVSDKVRFNDVALTTLSVKRADDVGEGPLRIEILIQEIEYGIDNDLNQLVVKLTLALSAYKAHQEGGIGEPAVSIEATFAMLYACDRVAEIPAQNLEAFANTNAFFNLWPFWREVVMNTTARMRITPIVVSVLRLN
jgi:hypothetical protein